jgi:AcrR family transcriptional regulator
MASLTRTAGRPSRRDEVERAVIAATVELLEEGERFAELGVERIATRAGIKRTAFYFYFRDKRELLMRVTEEVTERFYAVADTWWSSEEEGPDALRNALRALVDLYREHAVLLRAVVEISAIDETVASFWRALVGRFILATRDRIESERAAGAAPEDGAPAPTVAFALVWMTERAFYQGIVVAAEPNPDTDDALVAALSDVWLRSIYGRLP